MKKFGVIFFIILILSAVSMFTMMNHSGQEMSGCIALAFDGSICLSDTISLLFHHISAYQGLSQSLILSGFLLLSYLILIILLAFLSHLFKSKIIYSPIQYAERSPVQPRNRCDNIIEWLSLLENSPSL